MFEYGLKALAAKLSRDDSGATAIEYALIAGGIAVAIIAGVAAVGGGVSGLFNTIAGLL